MSRNMLPSDEASHSDNVNTPEVQESVSDRVFLRIERLSQDITAPATNVNSQSIVHRSHNVTSNDQSGRESRITLQENLYLNNSSPADNESAVSTSSVTWQSAATPASEVIMMPFPGRNDHHTQQSDDNITNHVSSVSNAHSVNVLSSLPETLPAFNITNDVIVPAQDIAAESNRSITSNLNIPQRIRHTPTNVRAHPYARSESPHPRTNSDVSVLTSDADISSASCPSPAAGLIENPMPRDLGIFVEKPKHPELASYEARLGTYSKWPKDHHFKPEVLARAGLYYVGRVDCARCFFCGGGMRNWQLEDDPCVEHARWFPRCPFICQYMGQEFVDVVKILKETLTGKTLTLTQVIDYMNSHGISQKQMYGNTFGRDDEVIQSVAERGFDIDRVRCVAVKLRESGNIVSASTVMEELRKTETQTDENNCAAGSGEQCSEAQGKDAELQQLRHQNEELRLQTTCKICMDREVQMAILPCGHAVSCQECCARLTTCPTCRADVKGVLRIYFA